MSLSAPEGSPAGAEELVPGARLAHDLCLIEPIGATTGAAGAVWCAEDTALGRVAVNVIAMVAPEARAIERFRREAALAARIASPHVVQIFRHAVSDGGLPYIVMDLLTGESLADHLARRGPPPRAEVIEIVTQVARGLQAAHELGVVHRGIKPANVFLVDAAGDDTCVKIGAPYMSPEQLTSVAEVDASADLRALAVMAYELLTGSLPFRGETVGALAGAMTQAAFDPPTKRAPDLPKAIDGWFASALSVEPRVRFGSAGQLARSFAEALREASTSPAGRGPRGRAGAPPQLRVAVIAVGAVVIATGTLATMVPRCDRGSKPVTTAVTTASAPLPSASAGLPQGSDEPAATSPEGGR